MYCTVLYCSYMIILGTIVYDTVYRSIIVPNVTILLIACPSKYFMFKQVKQLSRKNIYVLSDVLFPMVYLSFHLLFSDHFNKHQLSV